MSDATITKLDKVLDGLNSEELTEVVRYALIRRKQINDEARADRERTKRERAEKRAEREAARAQKNVARLAKLQERKAKIEAELKAAQEKIAA